MSLHRLGLVASEKKQKKVEVEALIRYLEGKASLSEGLGLDAHATEGLRRQAHALYAAGKWQQSIDILQGLAALGDVDPFDPLLMAGAYHELGDPRAAELCAKMGDAMMAALGAKLDDLAKEKR